MRRPTDRPRRPGHRHALGRRGRLDSAENARVRRPRSTATPSSAAIRTIAQAFTQGLEYVDGVLYEGTGLNGRSGIRKVKLETGEVLQMQPLDARYFGEGITVWKNRIIQLTWQSEVGLRLRPPDVQAAAHVSVHR